MPHPQETDREVRIQRAMSYCTHYDRYAMICRKPCRAGVDYETVGKNMKERPCMAGGDVPEGRQIGTCALLRFPTRDEAAAEVDETDRAFARVMVAIEVAGRWRVKPKPKADRHEVVECPVCKGRLHLTQSSYNGHVWGKCETEKCVSWME
jgi:hypothetical protein